MTFRKESNEKKQKYIIYGEDVLRRLFIALFALLVVLVFCVYLQEDDCADSLTISIKADENITQKVRLYHNEGTYYAFLPSYAEFDNMFMEFTPGCSLFLDGEYYHTDTSLSWITTNKEYSMEIKNTFGMTVRREKLKFLKADSVAALSIKLMDGSINEINEDKMASKSGFVTVINPDKSIDYSGSFKELHGRGNSTWTQEKKPYTLTFSEETDLLGMGAGKGWVLLANSFDESGLRNKLVFDAAKDMGVKYAVDSEYVDLYINDEYLGLYLLAERVEVGRNRVDITDLSEKTQEINNAPLSSYHQYEISDNGRIERFFEIPNNPDDITGGYLVQIEHHPDRIENKESLFETDDLSFSVSSPKYISKEQVHYISEYLNNIEKQLKNNELTEIDVDSFVKYYLLHEVFANSEDSSCFFCKDRDSNDKKLFACSVWDADMCIGNSWLTTEVNPAVLYCNNGNWINYLYDNHEFRSLLTDYYSDFFKSKIQKTLPQRLKDSEQKITSSFNMNKIRWQNICNTGTYADKSQTRFDTLREHIDYICDYMDQRFKFLDSVWIDGTKYSYVNFLTYDHTVINKWFSVKTGECLTEEPLPASEIVEGYQFSGWYDANGSRFLPGKKIIQDEYYSAKWESVSPETDNTAKNEQKSSPKEHVQSILFGGNIYLFAGFAIIICSILAFVLRDIIKYIKCRRGFDVGK